MAFAGMKVELGDRDRLLVHRLTDSLSAFAAELKRYNDEQDRQLAENVMVADEIAGMGTFTTATNRVIQIPPGAGDYEISSDNVRHRYGDENWHNHPSTAELLNCLTERGIL